MTSILGISMPNIGISKDDLTKPKTLALGGIATVGLVGGLAVGATRGHPLIGLGVGAAVAAVATGAALIGNASVSYRDGYCTEYGDPDCDYPGVSPTYRQPYYPNGDPGYRNSDGDGAREDFPDRDAGRYPSSRYPSGSGGATSRGDD